MGAPHLDSEMWESTNPNPPLSTHLSSVIPSEALFSGAEGPAFVVAFAFPVANSAPISGLSVPPAPGDRRRIPSVLRYVRADDGLRGGSQMKVSLLALALLFSADALHSQGPFSVDDALKQLYHKYDPATKTAQWVCTKEQSAEGMHAGWPCTDEYKTVSLQVILTEQVREGDVTRTYLAISAKPADNSDGPYNCHACATATGAAVFSWQGQRWAMESADAAIAFYGGWGDPPRVELVAVGPQKHGLILSWDDLAQGFAASSKSLLVPIGKTINEVWAIGDESDDDDAIDPNDKTESPPHYHSSSTIRFVPVKGVIGSVSDYYNIEVVSRGTSWEGYGHRVKPANWTATYAFRDGKYRMIRKTVSVEVKKPVKPASH